MDLSFPIVEIASLSANTNLLIALVLGLGFGIFLEQGGMGSANKIAGQFYLRDLSVLKIMFSAIVTAAIGLFWFSRLGLLDYDSLFVEPTFVWPQIVGGLLFGAGFVIGGLCPGTSCVAASSGRLDGMVLLLGMFIGIVVFNEAFPLFEDFYRSGSIGKQDIPDLLGLPHGFSLILLVAAAITAFAIAERIEKRSREQHKVVAKG